VLTTMVSLVKNVYLFSNVPHGNWQMLGEREQAVEEGMEAKIQASLMEILHSLPLPADFLNRILKSAQESARRALRWRTVMKIEHIHLKVFVPQNSISDENTWGFFGIEKVGTPTANTAQDDHSIEYYLYLEG